MTKSSRLLVFTENYARGGGNRYLVDLINSVESAYANIALLSNKGGMFAEDRRRLSGAVDVQSIFLVTRPQINHLLSCIPPRVLRFLLIPLALFEPFFFIANILALRIRLRRLKPTCVLSCNGGYPAAYSSLAMVVAARMCGLPVALSVVSMPTQRRAWRKPYERFIDRLVWKSADVVIVNANSIAQALVERREMPAELTRVIHNGLEDRPPFKAATKDDDHVVIGCVARLDAAKGVLFLFEAFVQLVGAHPQLRLVLAGSGDASTELERRIAALGLQDKVTLLGHFEGDINALLATFDVYVFPSLWEGFPYSIVEALRSACVIVATRVGGIPEAITDTVEGLLIEPGSVDAISRAVSRLLDDPQLRSTLATNARLRFERDLTLLMMQTRVRGVFARLQESQAR
jgi:glycosyltransferase involved in cell wall biosynthesis